MKQLPNWQYQDQPFNKYLFPWTKGIVYLIVLAIKNEPKYYIGYKNLYTKQDNFESYVGSNSILKNARLWRQDNIANIKARIILSMHATPQQALKEESKLIKATQARRNPHFVNKILPLKYESRELPKETYNKKLTNFLNKYNLKINEQNNL